MNQSDELETAKRHLKLAEDSHAQGSDQAQLWYLRSIARSLMVLCELELRAIAGTMKPIR